MREILQNVPQPSIPIPKDILVGLETSDDACVYQLNEEQAIVATTDFFMPILDDPYDFGRVAAANAMSDVYAMGASPIFALNIVCMPLQSGKTSAEVVARILEGGQQVCADAGVVISGGHTIDAVEPIYGLVALGVVHPRHLVRNSGAHEGDVLILGKGLGIGILGAALKKGVLDPAGYRVLVSTATCLNKCSAPLMHALRA